MNSRTCSRATIAVNRQLGQTIPLGLALIFFAILGALLLYNTSQLASEKTRLANTADAAAYSGLIWQARALNFQAYTNRAMVANELSIAQLVSLNSWTQYSQVTSRNINNTIGLIPVVRPFTQGVATAAETVNEVVSTIAAAGVSVVSGLNLILSEVQRGVYLGTFIMTPEVVQAVIEANDPNYTTDSGYNIVALGRNAMAWQSFTQRYDDLGGQARLADLINRSRHDFLRDRGWSTPNLPVLPAPPTRVKLRKEGSTQLEHEDGKWTWRGRDTISLHQEVYRCKPFKCRWRHTEIPIGWGEVYAGDDIRCRSINPGSHEAGFDYRHPCGNLSPHNRKAGSAARGENDSLDGYGGLRAYYDLRDLSDTNKDPRLLLRVKVGQPRADLRTAAQIGIGADPADTSPSTTPSSGLGDGMFRLDDHLSKNELQSLGSAELYFKRPDHDPAFALQVNGAQKREYASLFNPYWHVRLAPTEQIEQMMAWAESGQARNVTSGMISRGPNALSRYVDRQQQEISGVTVLVDEARAEIEKIDDYTQQLSDASTLLANADSTIEQLQAELASATPGSDVAARAQAELDAARRSHSNLTAQVQSLEERLDLAQLYQSQQQQYDQYLASLQAQAQAELPPELAQLPEVYGASSEQLAALAGLDSSDAWAAAGEAIADWGTDYLEDIVTEYAMDQAKELLADALKAILSRYGGTYAQQIQQVKDKADAIKDTAAAISASAIEPLLAQLESLEANLQTLEDSMTQETAKLTAEIQQEIDALTGDVTQSINAATQPLQDQLNQLNDQYNLLDPGEDRDRVAEQMAALENQIAETISGATADLDAEVADLMAAKDQVVADAQAAVEAEINKIREEIDAIREKIDSIQDHIN